MMCLELRGDTVAEGTRLGTASPLPALSPLRGEGGAQGALEDCAHQRATIARRDSIAREDEVSQQQWQCVAVERCVASLDPRSVDTIPSRTSAFEFSRAADASPSPLNGERAGVRGEAVRLASKTYACLSAVVRHLRFSP